MGQKETNDSRPDSQQADSGSTEQPSNNELPFVINPGDEEFFPNINEHTIPADAHGNRRIDLNSYVELVQPTDVDHSIFKGIYSAIGNSLTTLLNYEDLPEPTVTEALTQTTNNIRSAMGFLTRVFHPEPTVEFEQLFSEELNQAPLSSGNYSIFSPSVKLAFPDPKVLISESNGQLTAFGSMIQTLSKAVIPVSDAAKFLGKAQ